MTPDQQKEAEQLIDQTLLESPIYTRLTRYQIDSMYAFTIDEVVRLIALARQPAAQSEGDIHSCSYYCQRPECIKRQRDEFVAKAEQSADKDARIAEWKSSYDAKCRENTQNFLRAEAAEQRIAVLEAQIKAAPEGMVLVPSNLRNWIL